MTSSLSQHICWIWGPNIRQSHHFPKTPTSDILTGPVRVPPRHAELSDTCRMGAQAVKEQNNRSFSSWWILKPRPDTYIYISHWDPFQVKVDKHIWHILKPSPSYPLTPSKTYFLNDLGGWILSKSTLGWSHLKWVRGHIIRSLILEGLLCLFAEPE